METENGEGKPSSGVRFCPDLDKAYAVMRRAPSTPHLQGIFEALERELAGNAHVFIPVPPGKSAVVHSGEQLPWLVVGTPAGRLLGLFTSADQAARHTEAESLAVPVRAAFDLLDEEAGLNGFLLNPADGAHGIYLDRRNLEVCRARAGGVGAAIPRLPRELATDACFRLVANASGLATPFYDLNGDMDAAGGMEGLLSPVLDRWREAVASGVYRPAGPEACVRDVTADVVAAAFLAGNRVRRKPGRKDAADADFRLAHPELAADLAANVDRYLAGLVENVRRRWRALPAAKVWVLLADNLDAVGYGAACFGFGWGLAAYCAQQGGEVLAAFKVRQASARAAIDAAVRTRFQAGGNS